MSLQYPPVSAYRALKLIVYKWKQFQHICLLGTNYPPLERIFMFPTRFLWLDISPINVSWNSCMHLPMQMFAERISSANLTSITLYTYFWIMETNSHVELTILPRLFWCCLCEIPYAFQYLNKRLYPCTSLYWAKIPLELLREIDTCTFNLKAVWASSKLKKFRVACSHNLLLVWFLNFIFEYFGWID